MNISNKAYIENGLLVIPQNTKLPNICLISGEYGNAEPINEPLYWLPKSSLILIVILVPLHVLRLLFIVNLLKRRIDCTYFLSNEIHRKIKTIKFIAYMTIATLLLLFFFGAHANYGVIFIPSFFGIFLTLAIASAIKPAVKIKKIENGRAYIGGLSPKALQRLAPSAINNPQAGPKNGSSSGEVDNIQIPLVAILAKERQAKK